MTKLLTRLGPAAGAAGGEGLYPEDVFSTYLYAGSNGARTIANGISLSDEGGLVWLKNRGAVDSHVLFDTVNGPQKSLSSNSTAAGSNYSSYLSFPSAGTAGWNLAGATLNGTGTTWASWSFRKAAGFFDIVTYTGNGVTGRNISHALTSSPKMMIVKRTDTSSGWWTWHTGIGTNYILLNSSNPAAGGGIVWNNTAPTSTVFTVADDANTNGGTFVAYLFGDDAVFGEDGDEQICKMGSFSTTGNSTITLGFEPQWLLVKQTNGAAGWYIWDTMRGWTVGDTGSNNDPPLFANTTAAEVGYNDTIGNPTATGFVTNNFGSGDYIYMAIRKPAKPPTAGTEVFKAFTWSGTNENNKIYTSNLAADLMIIKKRNSETNADPQIHDRLRGFESRLRTYDTSVEFHESDKLSDVTNTTFNTGSTGSSWNASGGNYVAWMFKRAAKFFDIVAYTGNATGNRQLTHNLNAVPELMIAKTRDAANYWVTYDATNGPTKYMSINSTNIAYSSVDHWWNTAPTADVVTLGDGNYTNKNSTEHILYLFASVDGVSKVGTYEGNGSSVYVNCGFSNGARFVLIKNTEDDANWVIYDTTRGITTSASQELYLNQVDQESGTSTAIEPWAYGFRVKTAGSTNTSGDTYIFLAIA